MSDTESMYAKTEYQATEHGDSDSAEYSEEEEDDLSDVQHSKLDLDRRNVDQLKAGGGTTTIAEEPDDGEEGDGADEGQDGDDEGEGEEADGVPGESGETAAINASVFTPEVLLILRESWEEWKAADRKNRKVIWKAIGDRLHALDVHRDIDSAEWSARLRVYNHWMRRHGRGRGKNKTIRLGQKWTARSVIRETDKERLRDIIAERFGKPRNAANIECWQPALTILMTELSRERLEAAEATAKEWNSRGGSAEAQHRFATKGAYKVMKGFTEEMWKRGGLRLVILSGYKDDKGDLYSQIYDFNKKIADGPEFTGTDAILDPFDKYLLECFPEAEAEAKDDASEAETRKVKKGGTIINRDELIKKITMADGTTWIPDIADNTRAEKQALVRAFLTSHYRDACQKNTASAPFKKLRMFQDKLFLQHHLPRRFVFPDDPSHMTTGDATRFLTFVRKRQEEYPEDVFQFQYWLKGNRLMRPGNPDEDGEDADDSDNGTTESNTMETVNEAKEQIESSAVDETHREGSGLNIAQRELQPTNTAYATPCIADEEAPPTKGRSKGKERADIMPGSRSKGLKLMDEEVQPMRYAAVNSCITHEEIMPRNPRSKGTERAEVIPRSRNGGTITKDIVNKVVGHHTDRSQQASLPPFSQAQPFSLRRQKRSRKSSTEGKRKADIGESFELQNKASATITELIVQAPASAGLDNGNTFTFSMRPPKKSIIEQEKERLKGSVATRQPTPGPSKAQVVQGTDRQNPTGRPSDISGPRQKKTGHSVAAEKMVLPGRGTKHAPDQDGDEALHHAYREVPVVPLEHSDGQSKAAQPNHHKSGPPLRSAMKKKVPSSHVPHAHPVQCKEEGTSNIRASGKPVETPTADKKTVGKSVQERTEAVRASREVNTTGSKQPEQKRREVKRIHNTSADQPNRAQGSPTKWDIEEDPATPPMKMSEGEHRNIIPEQRITRKPGQPSGLRVGGSANKLPVTKGDSVPEPETPRRSGRNRRPPPPPDADFTVGQRKAKRRKRMD